MLSAEQLELLFEEFIREKRYLKNISPKTELSYRQGWKSYKRYAPGGLAVELSTGQLNKWVMAMRENEIKISSCNSYISGINAFVHWLYDNEVIERRIGAQLLKTEETPFTTLSDGELKQLADYKPKTKSEWRTHTVLSLLIDTGMRIDEALGSLLREVNFEQSLITIKGKGGKTRTIPISFEMRKRLWQWVKKRDNNPSPYLFPTSTYTRMEYHNYRRDLLNLCKKIGVTGVRIHPHGFRHYFAVQFLRRGGDLYRLSKILGHKNIQTTQIYLRSMGIDALQEIHQQISPLVR